MKTTINQPLISVIVPAYNRCEPLKETLESVVNQTYSNLEVIVIDDGSETDLFPTIKQISDPRIFYYKISHQNANAARNYGISICKGKYIAMLDSDDLWLENHLKDCLATLLKDRADGLYGSLILKNTKLNQEQKVIARTLKEGESMVDYLLTMVCGAQTSTLFTTAESCKSILWDQELISEQDYDFVIRYSKNYRLTVKSEPTTIYNIGSPSLSSIIDFSSYMRFLKKNEMDISSPVYHNYCLNLLSQAKQKNASSRVIEYFTNATTYYKELISLRQFLTLKSPKSVNEIEKYRTEYIQYLEKLEIE